MNSERNSDKPFFSVKKNGPPVKMLGDCGAPVNIINELALQKLSPPPDLQNPDMSLFPYGPKDKLLELFGMFAAKLTSGEKTDHAKIYIARGNHGRIPFNLRQKVKEEIKRLEDLDVIEIVDGQTYWVSPIVAAPKPKEPTAVRICVDM